MTSPRLAEWEPSVSLFPGVDDNRQPARVSTFWEESAPSLQKSPKFPKSELFVNCIFLADRPIF